MGAFGGSCAASKYIQCIEETDFRFLLEAKRCNMEKIGVCSHIVNVFVPCICWVFRKRSLHHEKKAKSGRFRLSKVIARWCGSSVS